MIEAFALACIASLALIFAKITHASYRHFDPRFTSRGNNFVRVASLCATLILAVLCLGQMPLDLMMSATSIAAALVAFAIFRRAIADSGVGHLHVAFTRDAPDALITCGIYASVRNPLYAAYLIYWFGWTIASGFHIVATLIMAIFLVVYLIAIFEEERVLTLRFREAYGAYQNRTWRLIPYLF